jgi:hypothetical protein
MFSFADALLLRPPAVRDPDRLVTVGSLDGSGRNLVVSYREYVDLRHRTKTIDGLVAFNDFGAAVRTRPENLPRMQLGLFVSGDFFTALDQSQIARHFATSQELSGHFFTPASQFTTTVSGGVSAGALGHDHQEPLGVGAGCVPMEVLW